MKNTNSQSNTLEERKDRFTPGEWYCSEPKIQKDFGNQTYFSLMTKECEVRNGTYVMPGFYYPHSVQTPEEMKANAEHIVKMHNNYENLVAALQLVNSVLGDWNGSGQFSNLIAHIDSALNKVK